MFKSKAVGARSERTGQIYFYSPFIKFWNNSSIVCNIVFHKYLLKKVCHMYKARQKEQIEFPFAFEEVTYHRLRVLLKVRHTNCTWEENKDSCPQTALRIMYFYWFAKLPVPKYVC